MKRLAALALSLVMLLSLTAPALAAEVTPAPPEWVKAEEYMSFPGDGVYEAETWDRILRLRADAAAGHAEPKEGDALYAEWSPFKPEKVGTMYSWKELSAGEWFERGLIGMKYAANSSTRRLASRADTCFGRSSTALRTAGVEATDPVYQTVRLWEIRAGLLNWAPTGDEKPYSEYLTALSDLIALQKDTDVTLDQIYDTPLMDGISAASRTRIAKDHATLYNREYHLIHVSIDGATLRADVGFADGREFKHSPDPVIINGRTMVPIRWIAEKLGGEVSWVAETGAARVTRAGVTIDMPIGSTTAYRNGAAFQMETAPYVADGYTMVPVRYVAEFFGQNVTFNRETRTVEITENKSLAGSSNLEAWALPMGSMLNKINSLCSPTLFGGHRRAGAALSGPQECRSTLNGSSWNIMDREDLIETVCSMTAHGHNDSFLQDVAMINSLSAAAYRDILKNAQGMDQYMFPYTKQLGEKWGDRGILCWDLFRMSNLVQWGYVAGYLTYPEALALLEPAAKLLHDNFKSWDEAYENYLDGYNWWARNNVLGKDVWETSRGKTYRQMKADPEVAPIFDDSLFRTPVVGVPDLTAEQLLRSVS